MSLFRDFIFVLVSLWPLAAHSQDPFDPQSFSLPALVPFWPVATKEPITKNDPFSPSGFSNSYEYPAVNEPSGPVVAGMLRVWAFATSDRLLSEMPMRMEGGDKGESGLFQVLREASREGKAELLWSYALRLETGHEATTSSISEITYPTEWEPDANLGLMTPTSFETKNAGCGLQATLRAAKDGDFHYRIVAGEIRPLAFPQWPATLVPFEKQDPIHSLQIPAPAFTNQECAVQGLMKANQEALLSVAPEVMNDPLKAALPNRHALTFARFDPDQMNEKKPAVEARPSWQLHFFSVRLSMADGLRRLWLHTPAPAKEWAHPLGMNEKDEVILAEKFLLKGREAITEHDAENESDTAKALTVAEYSYPTKWEFLIPTSFTLKSLGTEIAVRARLSPNGEDLWASIKWKEQALIQSEPWSVSFNGENGEWRTPEFRIRDIATSVVLPRGEMILLAALPVVPTGLVDEESEPQIELFFAKAEFDSTAKSIVNWSPQIKPTQQQYWIFSLDDDHNDELEKQPDELAKINTLWRWAEADSRILFSGGSLAGIKGTPLSASCEEALETPTEADHWKVGEQAVAWPTAWDTVKCGFRINDQSAQWSVAAPLRPGPEEIASSAQANSSVSEAKVFQHEISSPSSEGEVSGQAHIVHSVKVDGPTDSREHGRWHILVWRP